MFNTRYNYTLIAAKLQSLFCVCSFLKTVCFFLGQIRFYNIRKTCSKSKHCMLLQTKFSFSKKFLQISTAFVQQIWCAARETCAVLNTRKYRKLFKVVVMQVFHLFSFIEWNDDTVEIFPAKFFIIAFRKTHSISWKCLNNYYCSLLENQ